MRSVSDPASPLAVQAMEENFRGWLPLIAQLEGAVLRERYGCVAWTSALRLPFFNGVLGTPATDDIGSAIDDILAPYDEDDIPLLWVAPPPGDLVEPLTRRGFEVGIDPGMVLDLEALPPEPAIPDATVVRVDDDPSMLAVAVEIALTTNGIPEAGVRPMLDALSRFPERAQMHTFLAMLDGEPAATSTLFVWAGVAGLYNVGTQPGFRGVGLGRLVSVAAMAAGRSSGCALGVLQASEMGEPLYRSLGFVERCSYAFAARVPRGAKMEPT